MSGLIIDSTILFPNHQIAFRMPQTVCPSFPDFVPGLSGQLENTIDSLSLKCLVD
jgi:hypothetical protein